MSRIVPLCIAGMGAYWAYRGWFTYGFWVNKGPGGGFLAVIIGLLLVGLSLMESIRNTPPSMKLDKKHALPVLATVIMLLAIKFFGMIVSFGLFIIGWLIIWEKYPKPRALIIGAISTAVIYFIFKFFLQVPFPTGYLGI